MTLLDHTKGIKLDHSNPPFNNYQAFEQNYIGLKVLADTVREEERKMYAAEPPGGKTVLLFSSRSISPIVGCAFNWFSVTLVNYLRLVALVDLMCSKGWKSDKLTDPKNRDEIKKWCGEFVKDAVPEIYLWRNKVSAHFAATDPFRDDNLGTLEQSIMDPVSYHSPYFYVGRLKWNTSGQQSQLPSWALTKTYEDLRDRFWPEMQLRPVKDEI